MKNQKKMFLCILIAFLIAMLSYSFTIDRFTMAEGDSDANTSALSGNVRLTTGRGTSLTADQVQIDTKYCTVTINTTIPVYYSFLTLKEKSSVVKATNLKEATLVDGKYVIDYSRCKPTKSFCLGFGCSQTDYAVDGFAVDYKDEESYQLSEGGNVQTWKGNKYYTCLGSDFDYMLHIDAYYQTEVDQVSGIKWDANYPDSVTGEKLIMSAKIKGDINSVLKSFKTETSSSVDTTAWWPSIYDKAIKAEKFVQISPKKPEVLNNYYTDDTIFQLFEPYKQKAWTYPFAEKWPKKGAYLTNGVCGYATDFPYEFVWREKGETVWQDSSAFTGAKLKEYLQTGMTLEIRFDCIHDYHSRNRGMINATQYNWGNREDFVWGDRYSVPQNVKIPKAKVAKAPKLVINSVNETISIKNGMQYSFNGKKWITIYPYTALKKFVVFKRGMLNYWHLGDHWDYSSYYETRDPLHENPYSLELNPPCFFKKISTMSLQDLFLFQEEAQDFYLWNYDENYSTLYVRTLAKGNGLPSQVATVTLPKRANCPDVSVVNATGGGIMVTAISKGNNDPVDNPSYLVQIQNIEKGKQLLKEKLKSKYSKKSKDGTIELEFETADFNFSWMNCHIMRAITEGKLTAKGIWMTYYTKNNKWVYKLVNETVTIPFENNDQCKIYFRRKGIPAGKTVPSESAYTLGIPPQDPQENLNDSYSHVSWIGS